MSVEEVAAEMEQVCIETIEDAKECLFDAARYGDCDEDAKLALSKFPAAVNAQDAAGRTPLHMACANGHLGMVSLLIEGRADLALVNEEGNTVLHWAAVNGKVEVVHMLIKAGCDVRIKNKSGHTALDDCFDKNFHEVETLLLQHDKDIDDMMDGGRVRMAAGEMENAPDEDDDEEGDSEPPPHLMEEGDAPAKAANVPDDDDDDDDDELPPLMPEGQATGSGATAQGAAAPEKDVLEVE
uniref:Uncharacterized protein n=1 Tax=Eutreptiella gymnastica TaxID=73025 RepID=A0A7S4CMF1_9EUGL